MYTNNTSITDKTWSIFLNVSRNKLRQIKDYECYNESISTERWFVGELLMNCDKA